MSATLRVIVAGAGLGGLTLANSLAREGFEVCVLEQAQALGEVGAGVQISANGARVLHFLGLEERLREVAFTPERGEVRHWQTGEVLATRPLGNTSLERFGFPYYHLHRADFHRVLAESVEKMPNVSIHLNQKIVDLNQDNIAVTASTEVGSVFDADVVIGCDGIHSAVRTALFGPDQPRFTGCVAWRATIPTERLPKGHVRPAASNWIGKGGHFVHYYLRGGALVNCVGVIEQDQWAAESWSSRGKQGDFLSDFVEWHEDLKLLIQNADNCYRWGLF
ncbi:MAG: FAD-dependent monooxygenase, partial [Pseudomonadota bacterium]|nr:FAD-dependent monooxygenase [Pseudomonadota bacterium]